MPFDIKPHLMNYHTEGQGENTVRTTYKTYAYFHVTFIFICILDTFTRFNVQKTHFPPIVHC